MTHWTLAARAEKMNPSVIREILKVTEKPGIISLAGGLPSPKTFPVHEFAAACATATAWLAVTAETTRSKPCTASACLVASTTSCAAACSRSGCAWSVSSLRS